MIFLDTCAIIDFLRRDARIISLLSTITDELFVADITVFEVYVGVYSMKNLNKQLQAKTFMSQFRQLSVLDYVSAAQMCANLLSLGQEIPKNDCLLAAAVLQNGYSKLITRDTRHFSRIAGLEVISY